MLRKQWQDYALKAKQIAKHIITGLEQNKKGIRLVHIVYGLDMYATDALNLKYSKQRSKSSVHTYQGGRQEISTQHADGSEGLFKSNGEFQSSNNPMDTEVKEYMNNNLDENKQYNTNRNMNKKLIRLTEQDLHRIVKESAKRVLRENSIDIDDDNYFGGGLPNRYLDDDDDRISQKQIAQLDNISNTIADIANNTSDETHLLFQAVDCIDKFISRYK